MPSLRPAVESLESREVPAAVIVTPVSRASTEEGGAAVVRFIMNARPTANVVVPVSSSKPTEARPNVNAVVFTPATWRVPRFVRVIGRNDGVIDGPKLYSLITGRTISADVRSRGLNPADVALVNLDRVTQFDGTYTGSVTGTTSFGPINLALNVRVSRGAVTLLTIGGVNPWTGLSAATLSSSGALTFRLGRNLGLVTVSVGFTGAFENSGGVLSFSGNWSFNQFGFSGTGAWDVIRTGP